MEISFGADANDHVPAQHFAFGGRRGAIYGELGYIIGHTPYAAVAACLEKHRLTICGGTGIQSPSRKSGSHHLFYMSTSYRLSDMFSIGWKHMSNGARFGAGQLPNKPTEAITITYYWN